MALHLYTKTRDRTRDASPHEETSIDAPDPLGERPVFDLARTVFLRTVVDHPNISVGDYSYYDDPIDPHAFQTRNVLYNDGSERLIIGRFCALATGVRFVMNAANHKIDGISAFPFPIFGGAWAEHMPLLQSLPSRGDTVVGNDVWLGYESLVLPGVRIGNGAIVAARAVVTRDVPAYANVAGNPARVVRTRFSPADIARLEALAWWDWPIARITRNVAAIMHGDITALESAP